MLNKTLKIIIYILFIILPLVNSHLLDLFWLKIWNIYVNWNYEFTKVMFFNILSPIIIILFLVQKYINKEKIIIYKILNIILFLIILSSVLSISPFISIFWNNSKSHWFFMFINLIWLFIVLLNQKKDFLEKLLKIILTSSALVIFIAIWQYFLPSFNYWDLSNRALWTLWHPSYLVLYLIVLIPLLLYKIQKENNIIYLVILWLVIFSIILTKSAWWIFITSLYLIYYIYKNTYIKYKNIVFITIWILVFLIILLYLIKYFWYTKIYSFISRFYIWNSTLDISFSSIKTLLIWNWFETLDLIFEKYKNINLYIYENIWFTADRPHNLFLNIFYHTWILWLILIIIWVYNIIKNYIKNNDIKNHFLYESLILFFIYTIFNFSSIVSYLLIIFILAYILKSFEIKNKFNNLFIIFIIMISSILSITYSTKYYIAETYVYKKEYNKALDIFPYNQNYYYKIWQYDNWLNIWKYKEEKYYYSKIIWNKKNIEKICLELTNQFPTAENYFYCWEYLEILWKKDLSIDFYNNWLKKLPDLWNKNSIYYNNIFINKESLKHRFFSEKYSNIKNILKNKMDLIF